MTKLSAERLAEIRDLHKMWVSKPHGLVSHGQLADSNTILNLLAHVDALEEELKWRKGVHHITGEVDTLRAEAVEREKTNVMLSTELVALDSNLAATEAREREAIADCIRLSGKLAASEAREVGLRSALEWYANGGPVYDVWQKKEVPTFSTNEARRAKDALATEPPALLGVLKEAKEAIEACISKTTIGTNMDQCLPFPTIVLCNKALASLRDALGARG